MHFCSFLGLIKGVLDLMLWGSGEMGDFKQNPNISTAQTTLKMNIKMNEDRVI